MRLGPQVGFARRPDGHHLAYQVVGDGPLDLVFLFGFPSNLVLLWDNPAIAGFLTRLSSFARLILCDRLGNGLSDRGPTGHAFEDWVDDVRTVLAAAGSERAALFGARVMAKAEPGEILCSRTVKDLVAGASFAFAERGTHRLKSVPERWRLYAVQLAPG